MSLETKKFDVLVVGAGTSGACSAYCLAREGFRVALVDKAPLSKAGACWINAVPEWMFDRCHIQPPEPPELFSGHEVHYNLRNKYFKGPLHFYTNAQGIDMRLLVKRLHRLCSEQGVQMIESMEVVNFDFDGQRPKVARLQGVGPKLNATVLCVEAKLFVDSTGISGALRRVIPEVNKHCPYPIKEDVCSAAQQVRKLVDEYGAKEFLARHRVEEHAILTTLGRQGGYSTFNYEVDFHKRTVSILNGTLYDPQYKDVVQWIKEDIQDKPWIGEVEFGGRGIIPIRRPYDRFAFEGLALVGNAACQVFPVHGSGIGSGMIAGKILSEALIDQSDIGAQKAMDRYQHKFMMELGRNHASYDVFRIFSQRLDPEVVAKLLDSPLMLPTATKASLFQKAATPTFGELWRTIPQLWKNPRLFIRIIPQVVLMKLAFYWYALYPRSSSSFFFPIWSKIASLFYPKRFRY